MIIIEEHTASRLTPKGALFCALDRCILEARLSDREILAWVESYTTLLRSKTGQPPLTEPVSAEASYDVAI